MREVRIRLDDKLRARVQTEAARQGISQSQWVRDAIIQRLTGDRVDAVEARVRALEERAAAKD